MKNNKLIAFFLLFIFSNPLAAASSEVGLEISLAKYTELNDAGNKIGAFNVALLMAQRGDDRAQFIVGAAYANGIPQYIDINYIKAYAWMKLSTSKRNGIGRTSAIENVQKALSESELKSAEVLTEQLMGQYPSGKRILSPIIISKQPVPEQDPKTCNQTGTKIKGNCSGARSHIKYKRDK